MKTREEAIEEIADLRKRIDDVNSAANYTIKNKINDIKKKFNITDVPTSEFKGPNKCAKCGHISSITDMRRYKPTEGDGWICEPCW